MGLIRFNSASIAKLARMLKSLDELLKKTKKNVRKLFEERKVVFTKFKDAII